MGKYSDIVKGKNESGLSSNEDKPENQKTVKTESIKTGNVKNNKTGNQQNNITSNAENNITSKPENQKAVSSDMVNLSIKVPRRLRQKWVAESRLRGTTLTTIISDYLKTELGS